MNTIDSFRVLYFYQELLQLVRGVEGESRKRDLLPKGRDYIVLKAADTAMAVVGHSVGLLRHIIRMLVYSDYFLAEGDEMGFEPDDDSFRRMRVLMAVCLEGAAGGKMRRLLSSILSFFYHRGWAVRRSVVFDGDTRSLLSALQLLWI